MNNSNKKSRKRSFNRVCSACGSISVRKNGTTKSGVMRWRCMDCRANWVNKRPDTRLRNQSVWFKKWVHNGYTIKQLTEVSGKSKSYIYRILIESLETDPPCSNLIIGSSNLAKYKYLAFDGKFLFGRKLSLLTVYDTVSNEPIACSVVKAENKKHILPMFHKLKASGLNPVSVTTDGLPASGACVREVWPDAFNQRCLFHIKLQVNAWTRNPPRTNLGHELSRLVSGLPSHIKNEQDARVFCISFKDICNRNSRQIKLLNRQNTLERDLLRSISLIRCALPDMFYFISDTNIATTTSGVEGYFKQIQNIRGFRHSGLTESHLIKFIAWYVYFKGND